MSVHMCVCIALCTLLQRILHRTDLIIFTSYPPLQKLSWKQCVHFALTETHHLQGVRHNKHAMQINSAAKLIIESYYQTLFAVDVVDKAEFSNAGSLARSRQFCQPTPGSGKLSALNIRSMIIIRQR